MFLILAVHQQCDEKQVWKEDIEWSLWCPKRRNLAVDELEQIAGKHVRVFLSHRATGACETMIKKLYTFYRRLLAPRASPVVLCRAQSSLASACFLREGAWSPPPLAAGDGAIASDPSHGRPPKTGPVTLLRHTVASGSFSWPPPRQAKPELDLLARIATFQPKLFSAGRPVGIVFLQLSQDGIFVMRRRPFFVCAPALFDPLQILFTSNHSVKMHARIEPTLGSNLLS